MQLDVRCASPFTAPYVGVLYAATWNHWSRPNGSPSISASPTSWSSTSSWHMPATRPRAAARNISTRTSPARASSTSTRSPTARIPRRTCCPARPSSARRWSGLESAATTASSSMTIRRPAPQRAAGSCSAISAREQVAILDGGFQKWLAEGRPTESGEPAPRDARFERRRAADEVVTKQQILAGAGCRSLDARGKASLRGHRARPAARTLQPAISQARATCRSPRSTTRTAPSSRRGAWALCSPRPGSIPPSRSSPAAVRASRPPA